MVRRTKQREAIDFIDALAADPSLHVSFALEPGEINFLKNNAVLHGRTAYADAEEPASKRHMLRLWLTAHDDWSDGDAMLQGGIPKKDGVAPDAEALA